MAHKLLYKYMMNNEDRNNDKDGSVFPDHENTSIDLSLDLSGLWHDMKMEGNTLWELQKVKALRNVLSIRFKENDTVQVGQ